MKISYLMFFEFKKKCNLDVILVIHSFCNNLKLTTGILSIWSKILGDPAFSQLKFIDLTRIYNF